MFHIRPIGVTGPSGYRLHYPILPNVWNGEMDCIIGPFSSKEVASYYVQHVVALRCSPQLKPTILPKGTGWYITVGATEGKGLA